MLKKKYIKSRDVCKVTFVVPLAELPDGQAVSSLAVAGEFNDWDMSAMPLKYNKRKKEYATTIELAPNTSIQYRYVIDGEHWYNDWHADAYVPTIDADNCVVHTSGAGE